VAYHPPIFKPISRLTAERPRGAVLLRALRAGMLVYSPHTALDAAADGLTDWLAEAVGAGDVRALTPSAEPGERLKIVTFAPADAVERLRHALATAGAGRIGGYELCSFAAEGTGTFMGGAGTNPALGASGRFEQVWEVRLEMICPARAAALAVDTLRAMHPYEEPAIDVYPLRPLPMRAAGAGRRVMLDRPATLGALVDRVRAHLGVERLKFASPWEHEPERPVRAVGLCAGAGEELVPSAAENGCEVFVTGEMRHHEIMAALDRGMAVILAGHTSTERGYLPRLAQRLGRLAPGLRFAVSSADRTPIRWA
jgi:dinuclear metal center YbgI/SA1388 family protein